MKPLTWSSLICFWSLATRLCSSSSLAVREEISLSLRWMVCSSSFLLRSRSATASWVSLRSPSTFLLVFSMSALSFFSRSRESSSSSRVCSSLPLTLLRWLTLSSWAYNSNIVNPYIPFFLLIFLVYMNAFYEIYVHRLSTWRSSAVFWLTS